MSFPSAKSSSIDISKDNPKVVDKPVKYVRKSFSSTPVRSRIPKQGKLPIVNDTNNVVKVVAEKQDEKLPTSMVTPRPLSKSQDKPPTNLRARSIIAMGSDSNEKRVLENKFNQRKHRYITLTRDIEDKQKLSVTSYKELFQLREKILSLGGKDPGKLDDMNPLGSWFYNSKSGDCLAENERTGDDKLISQLEAHFGTIAESSLAFCREALDKRKDIVIWLTNFEREFWDDPSPLNCKEELAHQCESYRTENMAFEKRLDTLRHEQFLQIKEMVLRMSFMWQECQIYRQDISTGDIQVDNLNLDDHSKELKSEKDKSLKLRTKLREQETALLNNEKKLRQTQENLKQLELQMKQKDMNIETKSKELAKFQKTHEVALGKTEKQKETLESRLIKLKDELESKDDIIKNIANEYKEKIENIENELALEKIHKKELECQFEEFNIRNTKLEEKCKELLELQEKRKEVSLDKNHSEYEIQLFTDLKETQNCLAEKEKIIQKLQIERKEIIEAVNEADQENSSSNKKLTAEVLKKSNELQTLKSQFAQLQKNYKRMQQKAEHLEDKLADMNRVQAQMKDGNRSVYNVQVMQLQQQVTDLRSTLSDVNSQNEQLEKTCIQLQVKLEHYKMYMRNQDKNSKVRKEMQQLLHHNEDGYPDDIDQNAFNSINTDEFQQLYQTLENKEMQVMKLEKLVKQMEKQEENSQVQRTRLENRIAKLEIALKEGQQAHRNRGFSFL